MTELTPIIKDALIKIDFINRYEALSNKFTAQNVPSSERLVSIDGEEVMEMISKLGYYPIFDAKEKFYKIKLEEIDRFTFGVHIILQCGMADLVWVVKENDELILGAPWGTYSRRLGADYRIKKPVFKDYDELEEIIKTSFEMYEDFKKVIIKLE